MVNTESHPETVGEIGYLRRLLLKANEIVDDLTHPSGVGHVVVDGLFLAFMIWLAAKLPMYDWLPGRVLVSLFITVIGTSLLGGLYHYLLRRPLQLLRRRAAA